MPIDCVLVVADSQRVRSPLVIGGKVFTNHFGILKDRGMGGRLFPEPPVKSQQGKGWDGHCLVLWFSGLSYFPFSPWRCCSVVVYKPSQAHIHIPWHCCYHNGYHWVIRSEPIGNLIRKSSKEHDFHQAKNDIYCECYGSVKMNV